MINHGDTCYCDRCVDDETRARAALENMKGRAQTPEQKRAVIEAVYAAWLANPQLRLGQLLECVTTQPERLASLFYLEDFELARAAQKWKP